MRFSIPRRLSLTSLSPSCKRAGEHGSSHSAAASGDAGLLAGWVIQTLRPQLELSTISWPHEIHHCGIAIKGIDMDEKAEREMQE